MDQLTLLLALFAATVLLAPVAERFTVPYPVLLLVLGLAGRLRAGPADAVHQPRPDPSPGAAAAAVRRRAPDVVA